MTLYLRKAILPQIQRSGEKEGREKKGRNGGRESRRGEGIEKEREESS